MKRKKPQKAAPKAAKRPAAKPAKKPAKPAPKAKAAKAAKPAKGKASKSAPAKKAKAPAKKPAPKKAPAKKPAKAPAKSSAKKAAPAKSSAKKAAPAKKAPAKAAKKAAPGRLAGAGKAAAKLVKDTKKAASKLAGKAQKTVAKAAKAVKDTAKAGQKAAQNLVKQAKALPGKAAKAVKSAAAKAQKAGAKTPAAKNVAKAAAVAVGAAAAVGAATALASSEVKEKARELGQRAKELVEKASETISNVAADALKSMPSSGGAEPEKEAAPAAPAADLSHLSRKARKRAKKREAKAIEPAAKADDDDDDEEETKATGGGDDDEEEVVVEDDGEVVEEAEEEVAEEETEADEEDEEEEEAEKPAAAPDEEDDDDDDVKKSGRDPWSETEDEESVDDRRHRDDDDDDDDPSFSGPQSRKGGGGQSSGGGAGTSGPAGAPSSSTPAGRSGAASALNALSHEYWEYMLRARPQLATYLGDHRYDDRMPDVGPAGRAADIEAHRTLLKRLANVKTAGLALEDRLTADALDETLQMGLTEPDQKLFQWEVDQLMGPQVWFLEILNTHPLKTTQDYDNLLARMSAYPALIDQYLGNLRDGVAERRCAAQISVERVLKQLDEVLAQDPAQHPLAEAIGRIPATFAEPVRDRLATAILQAVRGHVNPALDRMRTYIRRDYAPHARTEVGCSALPDGADAYAYLIRKHTTTRLSAEEIHQIGLDEVAAIGAEMETILRAEGHRGPLRDVLESLRMDPRNLAPSREALLARYTADLDRITPKLPAYFARLPRTDCIIKPLEEFREKDAPSAYYYGPAEDGSRPGIFYANTYQAETRLLFSTTALTAHEAVPGHHLQVALAMELETLPSFRRHGGFTAYVEGWALYAERLCDEMGLYPDALARVGMLTAQGLRACRLVVDTGMHALSWTRARAIDFMREHLAIRDMEIINEIDRYIVWPGQALAYKVGQREISRLRAAAQTSLGKRFDLRGFHSAVLEHGALPLTTLGLAVDDWVAGVRGAKA